MNKRRLVSKLKVQYSNRRKAFETFFLIGLIVIASLLAVVKVIRYNNSPLRIKQQFIYFEPLSSFFRHERNKDGIKIDWHDYEFIAKEAQRVGPGEQGQPLIEVAEEEKELNQRLFDENGYFGLISDKISVNRSVVDLRHPKCKQLRYLKELPTVSVVIPFYNDHLSVLLRTVHSVINRSPEKLLKEVILINDRSTKEFLYEPLKIYLRDNFSSSKVKLLELPVRSGLIWARLAGARAANGDVLVFLDSHTEPNVNWLPPLLEPIALDYRTCVCPFIDVIEFKTFEYVPQDEGSRGIFDWNFNYRKLELQPHHQPTPTSNFESPVMAGGLFAISTKFFWELGGYDSGLDIWGGEQYELSFKIWLCGGKMFDSPCSRVGHIYRGSMPFADDRKGIDFLSVNYKRVAEVWMDDYKNYIYSRDPTRYEKAETGDLSAQLAIKEKLQCKPFSYFIETVAPDMLDFYPFVDPPPFAKGAIQSVFKPSHCIDTLGGDINSKPGLFYCATDLQNPQIAQFFTLRHFRDIEVKGTMFCFDQDGDGALVTAICHNSQGNQYFRYNLDTQQIHHASSNRDECLEMDESRTDAGSVYITKCNANLLTQKWHWAVVNETALNDWVAYGVEIADKREVEALKAENED